MSENRELRRIPGYKREGKWQEDGENCVMRRSTMCTHQTSLGWSNGEDKR
jgi:hypothetical protein